MPPIVQPSCTTDFINTIWPASPMTEASNDSAALLEESHESPYHLRLSDNKAEANKLLLAMLMNDIPRTVIHSILQSDSYDIIAPPNPSTAPYLVISYVNDTEEEYNALINNTHPAQDWSFLMVPRAGVTAADRDDDEDENEECYPFAEESAASYFVVELDELDDLESSVDLENYFSGCGRRRRLAAALGTSSIGVRDDLIPIGVELTGIFDKTESGSDDWSEDYALGDGEELGIGEGMDSSLELYGNDTESDLTEFSDTD